MTNIFAALILITAAISLSLLLILINNRIRYKKLNELLIRFNQLGIENQLSFSNQEILKYSVIGLDKTNKKLLFLKLVGKGKYDTVLIDLNKVKKCVVKKITSNNTDSNKRYWIGNHTKEIFLQVEFVSNKTFVELPFYTLQDNHIFEISQLETRAKDWEAILSKVISGNYKVGRMNEAVNKTVVQTNLKILSTTGLRN